LLLVQPKQLEERLGLERQSLAVLVQEQQARQDFPLPVPV
jgi:hypothetical protein